MGMRASTRTIGVTFALAILCSGVLIALSIATPANAQPTIYLDRPSFLAAVGESITDNYSAYGALIGPGTAPLELSNATMSAVLGQTVYESLTHNNLNLVGDVYAYGVDKPNYCSGCNGNFRLSFRKTSVSKGGAVFGVGVSILLHTSRRNAIGDDVPGDVILPGTVLIEFKNGEILSVTIPADVGFFGPQVYFLGVTEKHGIKSLTIGTEQIAHFWVIDDLTIAERPKGHGNQP